MPPPRPPILLKLARIWAYPLWVTAMRSPARHDILADVDWWVECLKDENLAAMDTRTRFSFFTGALSEFRTLVHYRLRGTSPLPVRLLMRRLYKARKPSSSNLTAWARPASFSTASPPWWPPNQSGAISGSTSRSP